MLTAHLKKLLRRDRIRQMQYRRREELAARAEQWDDYRLTLEALAHNTKLICEADSWTRRYRATRREEDPWGYARRSLRDNRLVLAQLGRHLPDAPTPTPITGNNPAQNS